MANWNAREWVADVLGCDLEDLSILAESEGQVHYADLSGREVAWLVVAGPPLIIEGGPERYHEIMLRLESGSFHKPDFPVLESTDIEF